MLCDATIRSVSEQLSAMSWPLPDRVFLPDIRKEGFWARRADVGTFGHCMSALQLGLQLLANLVALCCSLEGGFAKCYEVQDLETKEIFAALFSKL